MIMASYLRPRRISRSTNLAQSSTIQRMGASSRWEERAFSLAQDTHTTGGVHMADAGPGGGAGHGGPAGVSEQVQHRDRPSGPADLLLGEVPVGRLLGETVRCA